MTAAIDFIGRYDHTLDAKNRLMVPQAFRDAVGKSDQELRFYLTRGFEKCLAMYVTSTWREMVELLKAHKSDEISRERTRKFFRVFYSSAVEVTPDKAGRILIPDHLRELAGLTKKVVLVGVNDRIEIWDAERWNAFLAQEDGEYEKSASEAFIQG